MALMMLAIAGCVRSGSGIGGRLMGGGEQRQSAAPMPTDTYDNCAGRVVEGVNFLSSSGSGGTVSIGMTECELIGVLGNPTSVTAGARPGARRFVTMTYANPDGTATHYLFVDNALREMNRASAAPAPAPEATPPG